MKPDKSLEALIESGKSFFTDKETQKIMGRMLIEARKKKDYDTMAQIGILFFVYGIS